MPSNRAAAGVHFRKREAKPLPTPKNRFRKTGKYNSRGFRLDGIFFHSEVEANRYSQLKVMQAEGKIGDIETQVPYAINVKGHNICSYLADFRYAIIAENGDLLEMVVEDVKGMATPEYRLKKKLVEACHQVEVIELPGAWMKHYEGVTGPDCKLIVKQLHRLERQTMSARKAVRMLAFAKMREGRITLDKAITAALDEVRKQQRKAKREAKG